MNTTRTLLSAILGIAVMTIAAEREAHAAKPLLYGHRYSLQNGYQGWTGGYLDTRGGGCQDNAFCVSTNWNYWRDHASGNWTIRSATGKAAGTPVLAGDDVYLVNEYTGVGGKTFLDTRGLGCQGDLMCVSTATVSDRDAGSGTWRVQAAGGALGSVVTEGQEIHLLNGYDGFTGGYLDTRNTGCQDNKMCVATSPTWDRDGQSTHWRLTPAVATPESRQDAYCYRTDYQAQDILENDVATLRWDEYGNLTLVNHAGGAARDEIKWGINSPVPLTGADTARLCLVPSESRIQIIDGSGSVVWSSSDTAVPGGKLSIDGCTVSVTSGGTVRWQEKTPTCQQVTRANTPGVDRCWDVGDTEELLRDDERELALRWEGGHVKLEKQGSVILSAYENPTGTAQELCYQADGNLVVYDAGGAALWDSHSYFAAPEDVNLSMDECGIGFSRPEMHGGAVRETTYKRVDTATCQRTSLGPGWCRKNGASGTLLDNGSSRLVWDDDQLRFLNGTTTTWVRGMLLLGWPTESETVCLQDDGNLVLYYSGWTGAEEQVVWASGTNGAPGAQLNLDGCKFSIIDGATAAKCAELDAERKSCDGDRSCPFANIRYQNECADGLSTGTLWSYTPAACLDALDGGGFSYVKSLKKGNSDFGGEMWVIAAAVNEAGLSDLRNNISGSAGAGVVSDILPASGQPDDPAMEGYFEALGGAGVSATLFGNPVSLLDTRAFVQNLSGFQAGAQVRVQDSVLYEIGTTGVANKGQTLTFAHYSQMYPMLGVPITVEASLTGTLGMNIDLYAGTTSSLTAEVSPYASLDVDASITVGCDELGVGIEGSLELVRLAVPISETINLDGQFTSEARFDVSTLSGEVDLFAKALFVEAHKEIASFDGYSTSTKLFSQTGSL